MNRRLVWNFEIEISNLLQWPSSVSDSISEGHWEARYFWPEEAIILLQGLTQDFLDLSLYKIKSHLDYYFLLEEGDYNIKKRGEKIVYKPLFNTEEAYDEFGKKIDLYALHEEAILPGSPPINVTQILAFAQHNKGMKVEKIALTYKFKTEPSTKLELSKLSIHNKNYFSLCVESRSLNFVRSLSQQLIKNKSKQNYVQFLKQIEKHG